MRAPPGRGIVFGALAMPCTFSLSGIRHLSNDRLCIGRSDTVFLDGSLCTVYNMNIGRAIGVFIDTVGTTILRLTYATGQYTRAMCRAALNRSATVYEACFSWVKFPSTHTVHSSCSG